MSVRGVFTTLMAAGTIGSAVYDFSEGRMGASTMALAGTCANPDNILHTAACPLVAGTAVTSTVEGVTYFAWQGLKKAAPRAEAMVRSL